MTLLYIMNEHPSVTETFVVNEAAAVRALGVPILCYALKRGCAERPAAEVDLLRPPPNRFQLMQSLATHLPAAIADAWRLARAGASGGEIARSVLAGAHAAYVMRRARAAAVSHVHAHFLVRPSDVAQGLAARLGCAWTATAHGDDVYAPQEPRLLARRLHGVSAVACASAGVQQALKRRAAPLRVEATIVRCGIDTTSVRPEVQRLASNPLHLVTVGRLVPTKGHWTILEAASRLMQLDPALSWTIVGDGPLRRRLELDPRFVSLAPRMVLTGPMPHNEILELLKRATAFVLPCEPGVAGDSDGIPVALIEAMALGVPVVTTSVGGISELVTDGVTGLLTEPKDPSSLVDTLEVLLFRMSRREVEGLRSRARARVEQDFDSAHQARALVRMLSPYLFARSDVSRSGDGPARALPAALRPDSDRP